MTGKRIDNVRTGYTWTSYIASAEGALRSAGLWEGETWKLMGLTGIGFHFIVHQQLCPSSVTVYDWMNDHLAAIDRIGVHSEVYSVMDIRMNTYNKLQEDAVTQIKQSIQLGCPVVVWAPSSLLEFGLIHGYDDEDGVFFVLDCSGQPADPMLYQNLGQSEVPMLFYQLFKGKVDVNQEKVFRDSLNYGISEWEKPFHVNPSYASGRKAYENLIKALESGVFDDFGLAYNLAVYHDAKECITKYLRFLNENSHQLKHLDKASSLFGEISGRFKQLTTLFPFSGCNGSGCTINRAFVPEGLGLVRECFALEEQAFNSIRDSLKH